MPSKIPTAPEVAAAVTPLAEHEVLGVAVNGVELTSERIKGSFDSCAGHVLLRTRSYHYHALPTCLAESMGIDELTEGAILRSWSRATSRSTLNVPAPRLPQHISMLSAQSTCDYTLGLELGRLATGRTPPVPPSP